MRRFKTKIWTTEIEFRDGTIISNGKTFSNAEMKEFSKLYNGVNRIYKPFALLFWIDCNNGKQNNWDLIKI